MSKTVQFKRGNANVSATYVGAQGEITVNTDNYTLNVHDGVTAGGYTIFNANVSNIGNLVVTNQTIIGTSPNTNITISPTNANVVLTSNLVTPNIVINRYTIQSANIGSSLTLPAETDAANVELTNTFSNIRFTTYDPLTNTPYTLVLNNDSDVVFPGYIKSNLGGAEIQFAGGQGLLMYADFATGSTGISLNDTGTSDIFANADLRLTTNYSGAGKQWVFGSNGTLTTAGNLSTANLSIFYTTANNTVQARTLANSDLKISATDGTYESSIHLWANNQRMSFNTISNAFDFNFNGQLSATDFTASKNSAYGYSFYAEGSGYSGMRHSSGPPDVISIDHEGNTFVRFVANYTTDIYGNLVVSSDGETFGSFPDAFVQVYSNVDSYTQAVFQNLNEGASASTDVVVTADNGNDSSYYVDLGITSSQHADPEFFGDTTAINDAYLYVTGYDQTGPSLGNVGNLIIGSTNGKIKLFVGNTAEANVVATLSESLITVSGNIIPSANITYALGSETNQWRDLWVSNNTIYIGGVALSVDASGNLTVNGNVVSDGGGGSNYGNSNVASYLTTYTGNIAGNIVKNGYAWTFGTDGDLTLPITANSDTSIGTAFNTNPPGHTLTVKHNGGVTGGSGGELKFDYGNTQIKVVKDAGTTQTWTFGSDGTTQFPNTLILAPASESITMQSDQYSQLMWQNANVTVAPNMATYSNFYVAQNNATLDIGYLDGNSSPQFKEWLWGVDGSMTLPAAGRINFDYLSISSYNDVSAFYAPSGNVQLAAGTGDAQIVANSLNDSKTWIFGADGNLALPASGVLLVSGGITAGPIISSPAPYLSGFSSISAESMSASGNITGNTGGFAIGYRDIPQVVFTSNATLALTDAGKHYFSSNSANVITVPNNTTVSFSIGTAISIIQQGTANLTVTPDSGVTMYLAGNSTSASRTVGNYGMATLMKVGTDTWFINGTGVN